MNVNVDSVRAAMMEELGNKRLDTLPLDHKTGDRDDYERPFRFREQKPEIQDPLGKQQLVSAWNRAIEANEFDDFEAKQVKGLDDLGGPRVYATKRSGISSGVVASNESSGGPSAPSKSSRTSLHQKKIDRLGGVMPADDARVARYSNGVTEQTSTSRVVRPGGPASLPVSLKTHASSPNGQHTRVYPVAGFKAKERPVNGLKIQIPSTKVEPSHSVPIATGPAEQGAQGVKSVEPSAKTLFASECMVMHTPEGSRLGPGRIRLRAHGGQTTWVEFGMAFDDKFYCQNLIYCNGLRTERFAMPIAKKSTSSGTSFVVEINFVKEEKHATYMVSFDDQAACLGLCRAVQSARQVLMASDNPNINGMSAASLVQSSASTQQSTLLDSPGLVEGIKESLVNKLVPDRTDASSPVAKEAQAQAEEQHQSGDHSDSPFIVLGSPSSVVTAAADGGEWEQQAKSEIKRVDMVKIKYLAEQLLDLRPRSVSPGEVLQKVINAPPLKVNGLSTAAVKLKLKPFSSLPAKKEPNQDTIGDTTQDLVLRVVRDANGGIKEVRILSGSGEGGEVGTGGPVMVYGLEAFLGSLSTNMAQFA